MTSGPSRRGLTDRVAELLALHPDPEAHRLGRDQLVLGASHSHHSPGNWSMDRRWIRHPSYLGMMLGLFGWALVFRSAVGIAASVLGFRLLHDRIEAEETLLAAQFGATFQEYRRRTWRLLPGIY